MNEEGSGPQLSRLVFTQVSVIPQCECSDDPHFFRSAPNPAEHLGLNHFRVHLSNPYLCDFSCVCPAGKDTNLEADSWQPPEL